MSNEISAADRDLAFDHRVRLHDRFVADCHIRPNDENGPISTSAPIFAFGSTIAVG